MRMTVLFLALCVGLAALKAAATVIGLLIIAALIAAAVTRPAQTFGFMAGCMLLSLIGTYPWAAAVMIMGLALLKTEH